MKVLCASVAAWLIVASMTVLAASPQPLPKYDHIVIVIEENKDYDQVISNPASPYINGTLITEGANLTKMFGEEHYSEGNYFWLISGSNQNIGFKDEMPAHLFTSPNVAEQLIGHGLTFKGYSEDLPAISDTVEKAGHYARKHVPWVSFANIPHGPTAADSSNLRWGDFPANFDDLPTLSIVVPNLIHDMHDGKPPKSVKSGDKWLKQNIDKYYQWAKTHNSLLIITFDENDDTSKIAQTTDPASSDKPMQNRIPTIIAGARQTRRLPRRRRRDARQPPAHARSHVPPGQVRLAASQRGGGRHHRR